MKKSSHSMLFVVGGAIAGLTSAALVARFSPGAASTLPLLAIVFGYTGGYVGARLAAAARARTQRNQNA